MIGGDVFETVSKNRYRIEYCPYFMHVCDTGAVDYINDNQFKQCNAKYSRLNQSPVFICILVISLETPSCGDRVEL